MKNGQLLQSAILVLVLMVLCPQPAAAYIGPGAGLSAVGVLFAIVAAVVVAIFGFLWYPIKRLMRGWRKRNASGSRGEIA